jgi:hypothetical protein
MGFARRYHLPRSEEQNAEKALEIRDGEPLYDLAIFDPNGVKVEDTPVRVVRRGGTRPLEPGLADLYRAARRNALGVDKLLDDRLAELPATQPGQEPARL